MIFMVRPQANNVILDFELGTMALGQPKVQVVDIPRALSLVNRKSYRSGYVYAVDYIEYIGYAYDELTTFCMPCSYPLFAAYKLVFDEWRDQRSRNIADSGIEPGKWSDFKPYYNTHHFEGTWEEVYPIGKAATPAGVVVTEELSRTGSEWNRAELVFNDAAAATVTQVNVGMLGGDDLGVSYGSAMNVYGETRVATLAPDPLNPTASSASWITRVGPESADQSEAVINLLENENDFPPYANETDVSSPPIYNGGPQSIDAGLLLDQVTVGSTGRAVTMNGGLIPFGMFCVVLKNLEDSTLPVEGHGTLRVHCSRGEYKGVAAMAMGEFN